MQQERATDRHTWWACAVVGLGFAVRVSRLAFQSLWRDETDALFFATRPLERLLATFATPGRNGPLYFLTLRGWIELTGESEFALRFLSVWAGVLALALTAAVARKLGCPQAGWWALPLLAVSPFLTWYAQDAKMYSPLLAAILLATWLFWHALSRRRRWPWLAYALTMSAALYLHLLAALAVPVHLAWLAVERRRLHLSRGALLGLAGLAALALPLLVWEVPLFLSDYQTGHPPYPLGAMVRLLLAALTGGVMTGWAAWWLALPIFLVLAGLFLPTEGGPPRRVGLLLLLWVVLPAAALYGVSLRKPLFTERYLIWIAPAWHLLLGLGLERLAALLGRARGWAVSGALLAVLLGLSVGPLWHQTHTPLKSDFRAAAAHVEASKLRQDLVVFQMPHVRRTFQYYYRQPYRWADAPYTNGGMALETLDGEMRALTAGYQRVWLVLSEPEMWDQRGLVRAWLEAQGLPVEEQQYARVEVRLYEMPAR
ncbi:MAG: hypothetical protein GX605_02290 [Chloroflexi bacterium]|nr:hypothetical protein [Chloroflexota bacterium]